MEDIGGRMSLIEELDKAKQRVRNSFKPGTALPGGTWCGFCKVELCRTPYEHFAVEIEKVKSLIKADRERMRQELKDLFFCYMRHMCNTERIGCELAVREEDLDKVLGDGE